MDGESADGDSLWSLENHIPMDLHTAASLGCDSRIHDLLNGTGVEDIINKQNRGGWTPLMYAACNDSRVVRLLINKGASTSPQEHKGLTALMLATKCGNTESASLLIEIGADIEARDLKGWTALFHAASYGHRTVLQFLLQKGCKVHVKDKNAVTPLMLATEAGQDMIVKDLLQYEVDGRSKWCGGNLASVNSHIQGEGGILECQPLLGINIPSILEKLGLSKYCLIFERRGIDLNKFWALTDDDLKEIGINCLGPRRKLTSFISKWHENRSHLL